MTCEWRREQGNSMHLPLVPQEAPGKFPVSVHDALRRAGERAQESTLSPRRTPRAGESASKEGERLSKTAPGNKRGGEEDEEAGRQGTKGSRALLDRFRQLESTGTRLPLSKMEQEVAMGKGFESPSTVRLRTPREAVAKALHQGESGGITRHPRRAGGPILHWAETTGASEVDVVPQALLDPPARGEFAPMEGGESVRLMPKEEAGERGCVTATDEPKGGFEGVSRPHRVWPRGVTESYAASAFSSYCRTTGTRAPSSLHDR